ncbi:glycosyltransferase family 39 protein [Streptacidiphilus sp. N1-3]|uniref:Glycosyltransferase family 39 protein n=1 Tax=Streptacidiphilus alkalitolerans TaxID=3342712 RepID=A0ABV6X7A4_9ACTN
MTTALVPPRRIPDPAERGIRAGATRTAVRRTAVAVGGYLAVRAVGLLALLAYGSARHLPVLARLGGSWDAGWYVRIVRTGYGVSNGLIGHHGIPYSPRAFFPLYPGLAEPLYRLLPFGAATDLALVSAVAGAAAAAGIHSCAAHCHGHRTGVVAAVLWGVLPLAAVENMGYSESLFTAFAAWTLYAVLTRRWLAAGVLSVLAGLTRPTAMAVTAAVAAAALVELHRLYRQHRLHRQPRAEGWQRPLAAGLLAPLGWLGYMLWTGRAVGSWGGYFHIQDAWGSSFDGGLSALRRLLHLLAGSQHRAAGSGSAAAAGPAAHTPHISTAVTVLTVLVMAATVLAGLGLFVLALIRRQPLPLLVYSAALLVMDLGNSSSSPPLARFLLPAFALLFPAAEWLAGLRRGTTVALLGSCALLSGLYGIVVVFLAGAPA